MASRHRRSASSGDATIDLQQIMTLLKSLQTSATLTNTKLQENSQALQDTNNKIQAWNETLQTRIQIIEENQEQLRQNLNRTIETELARHTEEMQTSLREDTHRVVESLENRVTRTVTEAEKKTQQQVQLIHKQITDIRSDIYREMEHKNEEVTQQIQNTNDKIERQYEKVQRIEQSAQKMDENLTQETTTLLGMIHALQEEERRKFEKIENRIPQNTTSEATKFTKPLLKPEQWPKYKGAEDKIHPMTYLKTILKLCEGIPDDKIALNYIRLTLEHRALDWYDLISDKCQKVEQFSYEFKKQYWSELHQDRQKVKLITGKYSREGTLNRENYACDMYNRCKHIPGLTEQEIARYLLHHFILSDNQSIVCQDVQNMEQLMGILRRLDNLTSMQKSQNQIHSNHSRTSPHNSTNYNKTHQQTNHSYNNRQANNGNYSGNQNFPRYGQNQQNYHGQNYQHSTGNNGNYQSRFHNNNWHGNRTNNPNNRWYQNRHQDQRNYQNSTLPRSSGYNAYERQNAEYYGRNNQSHNNQGHTQGHINLLFRDTGSAENNISGAINRNPDRETNLPQEFYASEKKTPTYEQSTQLSAPSQF